jgi:hypothetical protein
MDIGGVVIPRKPNIDNKLSNQTCPQGVTWVQDVNGGIQIWTGDVCACNACAACLLHPFTMRSLQKFRALLLLSKPTIDMAWADDGITGVAITYNGYIYR